jgi:hypothetical protein
MRAVRGGPPLVSALVAFTVEWLVKPRLEMRKERILRRWRAKDEVWRTLDRHPAGRDTGSVSVPLVGRLRRRG